MDKAGIKEQALKQISEGLNNDAVQASAKLDAAKENIKKTNRDSNLYQNTINRAINNLTVKDVERVMLNVHDTKMINNYSEIILQGNTIGNLAIKNRELVMEQESLQKNIDTNQKEFDGIVSVEENNNQEPSKRETQLYKTLEDLKKQKNVVADRIHANNTLIHEAEIKLQQSEQKKAEESEKQTRKNCELVIYTKWLQNKLKWVEYINKVPRQTSKDEIAEQGVQQVDVEHTRAKEQTRVARVKKEADKAQEENERLKEENQKLKEQKASASGRSSDGSTQTDEMEGEGLAGKKASTGGCGTTSVGERGAQGKEKEKEKESFSTGERGAQGKEKVESLERKNEELERRIEDLTKAKEQAVAKAVADAVAKEREEARKAIRETRKAQEEAERIKKETEQERTIQELTAKLADVEKTKHTVVLTVTGTELGTQTQTSSTDVLGHND
ncbi:hypothetical protein AGMMS49556_08650 [Endomicrobiia bacterium]|nr:hypothetical protein AGMMS49556_08650 [Endomicrobiia bacterium]